MSKDILSLNEPLVTTCCCISYASVTEPPTNESAVTVIDELAVSISNIWFLTGTTSFDWGFTVNSITVEESI